MFVVLFLLIYYGGRMIGLLALSLTAGRDVVLQEHHNQQILSVVWLFFSLLLTVIICLLHPQWMTVLPR